MSDIYKPGGYPIEQEKREEIAALPSDDVLRQLVGRYQEVKFDPRKIIRIENQGSMGACAGHSLTSVMEFCHAIASGKTGLQLSRAAGYFESQRLSGITGDKGSLISDGVKLAMNTGICEERLWPYPSRYNPRRPSNWSEVLENAEQYKIGKSLRITSYEGFRTFLGSGQGGIHIGISWGRGMSQKVVEQHSSSGGGHAIAGLCLSERTDSQGRPYAWIANSWSESWGQNGWSEWSPRAIEQMLRHRFTVMVGLSDMPNVEPREFTVEDLKKKLRV
jgi:hypothetical protein